MIFNNYPEIVFATSKVSDGNMSIYCGDFNQALKNKNKFFKKININPKNVIELKQVHGNKIIKINKIPTRIIEADGLITSNPNVFLMIKAADCHQIAFYDPKNHAIALIHAGWQGLDKGIIKNVVNSLKYNFGTKPKDLIVQFGPSIGPCCYKKLPDLKQKNDPTWKLYIHKDKDDTFGLDLWKFAENQLKKLGVNTKNIDNPKICTYHHKEYFSHRRVSLEEKGQDYRFATIFGIKQNEI